MSTQIRPEYPFDEIRKYDYLYENNPTYGQINSDEPRFVVALNYTCSIRGVKTILDAGVGRGGFYNLIKNRYDVFGLEPSKVAIIKFHMDDERIKNILIQEIPNHYQPDAFDLVTCLDVLEHIPVSKIEKTLQGLRFVGKKYYIISVASHEDIIDGLNLHVNLRSYEEWEQDFQRFFNIISKTFIHNQRSCVYLLEDKLAESVELRFDQHEFSKLQHKDDPLFSILVPTYNQAKFLPEALDSLLAQTYTNWEAIVVNDGSTDDTPQVMKTYAPRDKRLRMFHKVNGGVASALNMGLQQANGKWICWLSSDDLFEPDALVTFVQAIQQQPSARFFHSHFYELHETDGVKIATWPDRSQTIPAAPLQTLAFFQANYVHGISVAIHHTVFDTVGHFDETYPNAQDVNMWLRISAKYPLFFINHRTCVTRVHNASGTSAFPEACFFDIARSAIDFLNRHPFQELFPHLNWDNPQDISLAIEQSLRVGLQPGALMYRGVGYVPALLERLGEWYSRHCPARYRQQLTPVFQTAVESVTASELPDCLKTVVADLAAEKPIFYKPYEPLALFVQQQNWLQANSNHVQAAAITRYLDKINALPAQLNGGKLAALIDAQRSFATAQSYMSQNQPIKAIPHLLQTLKAQSSLKPAVKMLARAYLYGQQQDKLPELYQDYVKNKPAFSATEKAWFENMLPRKVVQ